MNNRIQSQFAVLALVATVTGRIWMPTAMSMEQVPIVSYASVDCVVPTVPAAAQYRGTKFNNGTETRLRISNGGGGRLIPLQMHITLTEGPYQPGSLALLAHWLVLTSIGPENLEGKRKTTSYACFNFMPWTSDS